MPKQAAALQAALSLTWRTSTPTATSTRSPPGSRRSPMRSPAMTKATKEIAAVAKMVKEGDEMTRHRAGDDRERVAYTDRQGPRKPVEREADSRAKILLSEIEDLIAARTKPATRCGTTQPPSRKRRRSRPMSRSEPGAPIRSPGQTRAALNLSLLVPQSQLRRQRSPSGAEEPGRGKARRADHHRQG